MLLVSPANDAIALVAFIVVVVGAGVAVAAFLLCICRLLVGLEFLLNPERVIFFNFGLHENAIFHHFR